MFLDMGVGILLALGAATLFNWPLTFGLAALCVIFALLPDIDMLSLVSKRFGEFFGGHRGWMHAPIFYLHLAFGVALLFGVSWGLLFFLGVMAHLIHDTVWIGPGIQWFWPVSLKSYKFFNIEKPYTPGPITWVKDFYFSFSLVSLIEYGVFVIALIALLLY